MWTSTHAYLHLLCSYGTIVSQLLGEDCTLVNWSNWLGSAVYITVLSCHERNCYPFTTLWIAKKASTCYSFQKYRVTFSELSVYLFYSTLYYILYMQTVLRTINPRVFLFALWFAEPTVEPIGFTAVLTTGASYDTGDIMIFDLIQSNLGGYFNKDTSVFVCPTNGNVRVFLICGWGLWRFRREHYAG